MTKLSIIGTASGRAVALALLVLIALCPAGFGQAISGNLVGTVLDSTGAAVANADVEATNVATNIKSTTKSNQTGEYRFTNLPVGDYVLAVKASGFATVHRPTVVELNKTGTVNITVQPGKVTETVEVSGGAAAPIDTTTAQLETTYEIKQAQDLPTAAFGGGQGGGVLNLSLLQSGVASSGGLVP